MIKTKEIISLKNLSIGYQKKGTKTVVASKINATVQAGNLVAIVGANGVGKSTLIRTLAGVQPYLSGEILLNQKSIKAYTQKQLAQLMSLVLTEPIPAKNLTVKEVVALGRQPYTNWLGTLTVDDIKAINNAIKSTQIEQLKDQKCYELSDGQLQKVMLARALAQQTNIILLDEPTTHLDIYHKVYILKLLQQIAKSTNRTILFSTHEIDLAINLCDYLLIMTADQCYYNTPKKLIELGVFNQLFPGDLLKFDAAAGKFNVNK